MHDIIIIIIYFLLFLPVQPVTMGKKSEIDPNAVANFVLSTITSDVVFRSSMPT